VSLPAAVAEDLALLAACWRSIGLRAAVIRWDLTGPARLREPLATRLRSALGPALAAAGARPATLAAIPGDSRAPALWFRGWDCPDEPVTRVEAELRCVGAVAPDWPDLVRGLARLCLPAAGPGGSRVDTRRCSVTWRGGSRATGEDFGPPLVEDPALDLAGGACVVEAQTPLRLRSAGREVAGPPPLDVLVRSAGDRLRQLCEEWSAGMDGLPPLVARAHSEAGGARLSWARAGRSRDVPRRSSRTGQLQLIGGVRGVFAYDGVSPLAMAVLALGAEVGVGKGTAFGCGQIRLFSARSG
jgi:CRISPR-associated endoribonuclease Cas6